MEVDTESDPEEPDVRCEKEAMNGDDIEKEARSIANRILDEFSNEGMLKSGRMHAYKRCTKDNRVNRDASKHKVLPPCDDKCKKGCCKRITEEDRAAINAEFWELNFAERKLFIRLHVERHGTRSSTVDSSKKRSATYVYFFDIGEQQNKERLNVCQTMFLTTLGYKKGYNEVLKFLSKDVVSSKMEQYMDKRGKHEPKHKLDIATKSTIAEHVESFHPIISHYRRVHAPNRRYLPADITIKIMHADYNLNFEEVSYNTYRKIVAEMNISFSHLGNEECEICEEWKHHNHDDSIAEACAICCKHSEHKIRYTKARIEYQSDRQKNISNDNTNIIVSADLMKVIVIPIMPFKACIFCPRAIVFNETFSPLGTSINKGSAMVWDESTAGRKSGDICCTFIQFIIQNRDATTITIWADNCSGQNKNWLLFTSLLRTVHRNDIAVQSITIKFLETGHTFMSADTEHAAAEKAIAKKQYILDIDDFAECVQTSRLDVNILKTPDFLELEDWVSQYRLRKMPERPYLDNLVEINFRRGSRNFYMKHDFQQEYKEFSIVKENEDMAKPMLSRKQPRGIQEEKKKSIIDKLTPLMPQHRRNYWINLPSSKSSKDLSVDFS